MLTCSGVGLCRIGCLERRALVGSDVWTRPASTCLIEYISNTPAMTVLEDLIPRKSDLADIEILLPPTKYQKI